MAYAPVSANAVFTQENEPRNYKLSLSKGHSHQLRLHSYRSSGVYLIKKVDFMYIL